MQKLKVVPRAPLSKAEVAERLGISEPTVQKLINTGRLRAIRISETCVRVLHEDLEAFLTANATIPRKEEVLA
jgi:excisionase family DNA binding protein